LYCIGELAAIGFAGIGHYPGLLRHLANDSHVLVLGRRTRRAKAHMPLAAARWSPCS
jgi:hypothetical protein